MGLIDSFLGGVELRDVVDADECAVSSCGAQEGVQVIELQPLDPIDHAKTLVPMCEHHRKWANERNQLATDVANQLREARQEIGQTEIDRIQRLQSPPDGEIDGGLNLSMMDDIAADLLGGDHA